MKSLCLLLSNVFFFCFSFAELRVERVERPEYHFPQLQEIITRLNEQAPDLLLSKLELEEASIKQEIVRSSHGANLEFSLSGLSIQEDRPNRNFDQRDDAFASLNAKKPIYHSGALEAKETIAELEKYQAESNLEFRKKFLEIEIRALFLELVVLHFRKATSIERISLASQNLNDQKIRQKKGMVSMVDVSETEMDLINQEIVLSELKLKIGKEEAKFRSLSGFDNVLDFEVRSSFLEFCRDYKFPDNFLLLVGGTNLEINQLESFIKRENQKVVIAESEMLPKFNLVGSVFQDQVDTVSNDERVNRNNILFGIEASWALWDSGKSKNEKRASIIRKRMYQTELELARRKMRMFTESKRKELLSLLERITLSRKLLSVSMDYLSKCEMEFSQSRKSDLDLLSAQLEVDSAKLANIEAVCRYLCTLDLYEQQLGAPSFSIPQKR
jgi:outer membrane protein TolC